MLLPEPGEEYRRDTVQKQYPSHIHDTALIAAIPERGRNRPGKDYHRGKESGTHAEDRGERIGVDRIGIHPVLVGEPETPGLQAEHKSHLEDSDIRHELGHHAIALCSQEPCIERDKQEIDDPGQYRTEPVNGGLPRQLFQRICHNGRKIIILSFKKDIFTDKVQSRPCNIKLWHGIC